MSLIKKLETQKNRAENLSISDKKELDDIISKTKLYIKQLFPGNLDYEFELTNIEFSSKTTLYGDDLKQKENDRIAWKEGKDKLVNYIDTRLEEIELLSKAKDTNIEKSKEKIIYKDRVVKVEDISKINELKTEINNIKNKKNLWQKINWGTFLTILIPVLGGVFLFGKYIGENRFDIEKIELFESNKSLITKNDSLNKLINNIGFSNDSLRKLNNFQKNEITNLTKRLENENKDGNSNTMKLTVSYLRPTSIFDGQVLITAKKVDNRTEIKLKGTNGISDSRSKSFYGNEIIVKSGDRFFFKDHLSSIWTVNIFDTTTAVDMEIFTLN